jgi:hypothetical protein
MAWGVPTESKERFQLLADAASLIQVRRHTNTSAGWYFSIAAIAVLASVFRVGAAATGCVICAILLGVAGLYSLTTNRTEVALASQLAASLAVIAYSAYSLYQGDGIGIVFAVALIRPVFGAVGRYRTFRATKNTGGEYVDLVASAFTTAIKSDPVATPNLIALRRSGSFWSVLTSTERDYQYRLLFVRDLIFLFGQQSFLGLAYSTRIRLILPSRTFHIDEVGESWSGKRKRVNLMLDTDPVSPTVEITPEMLEKVRHQMVSA